MYAYQTFGNIKWYKIGESSLKYYLCKSGFLIRIFVLHQTDSKLHANCGTFNNVGPIIWYSNWRTKSCCTKMEQQVFKVDHLVFLLSQWCTIVAYQIPWCKYCISGAYINNSYDVKLWWLHMHVSSSQFMVHGYHVSSHVYGMLLFSDDKRFSC